MVTRSTSRSPSTCKLSVVFLTTEGFCCTAKVSDVTLQSRHLASMARPTCVKTKSQPACKRGGGGVVSEQNHDHRQVNLIILFQSLLVSGPDSHSSKARGLHHG